MQVFTMIGNLTKNPDLRMTTNGKHVCTFTVAVNRHDGKDALFMDVVTWETLAQSCAKYLSKGSKVAVKGEIQQRRYTDGQGVQRTAIETVAQQVEFLSPKSDAPAQSATEHQGYGDVIDDSEELPF